MYGENQIRSTIRSFFFAIPIKYLRKAEEKKLWYGSTSSTRNYAYCIYLFLLAPLTFIEFFLWTCFFFHRPAAFFPSICAITRQLFVKLMRFNGNLIWYSCLIASWTCIFPLDSRCVFFSLLLLNFSHWNEQSIWKLKVI